MKLVLWIIIYVLFFSIGYGLKMKNEEYKLQARLSILNQAISKMTKEISKFKSLNKIS